MKKERDLTIDASKVISMIIIVFGCHLIMANTRFDDAYQPEYGDFIRPYVRSSLAIFTFMSAYFLKFNSIKCQDDAIRFYKKRFVRLYPLYLLALFSFCLTLRIKSISQLIFSIFGLGMVFSPAPSTLWFINMLIIFYAITPIILFFVNHKAIQVLAASAIGLLLFTIPTADDRLFHYYPYYAVGLISTCSIQQFFNKWYKQLIIVCLFLLWAAHQYYYDMQIFHIDCFGEIIRCLFIILIGSWLTKVTILNRCVELLAYASMGIYMFHRPIFTILYHYHIQNNCVEVIYTLLFVIPVMCFIGYKIQKLYDVVFYDWVYKKLKLN